MRGLGGGARIGNHRNECRTCNNFARNVDRVASRYLRDAYLEEYRRMRKKAEWDLYPQVIEKFTSEQTRLEEQP